MNRRDIGSIFVVDAFVGEDMTGNPAAVCPRADWLSESTMQGIAQEMGLSETAFFAPRFDGQLLRWFTPITEVDLCGHATLASAAVYFANTDAKASVVHFYTLNAGLLRVSRRGELLEMDFPSRPAGRGQPEGIREIFGATPVEVLRIEGKTCMAVFEDEEVLRSLSPDPQAVMRLKESTVIATAPGKSADFVSRVFAPRAGIPEDPVTGSAHTTLVPYWSARLGRTELHAVQVSPRGGELFCADRGDRVAIAGRAAIRSVGRIVPAGPAPRVELAEA